MAAVRPSEWILSQPLRTRRLLALLAGPAVILTLCSVILGPVIGYYESHQDWLADAEVSVARDRGLRQAEPELRKRLAEIEQSPLLTRLYPADSSRGLATAVQADVGSLLARAGATAQTITPLPSSVDEVIERAGVRVALNVTVDQLRNLIGLIESHSRLIRAEELVITAPQSQLRDHNPTLNVSMVLFGFRLRQALKPAALSGTAHPGAAGPGALLRGHQGK